MSTQYSRILIKRSTVTTETPTIPASSDFTDGTWTSTDIHVGEIFFNVADDLAWFRSDNGLVSLTDTGTDLTGTQVDNSVTRGNGTDTVQSSDWFIDDSGQLYNTGTTPTATLHFQGSGSTDATSSLIIENTTEELWDYKDDGTINYFGNRFFWADGNSTNPIYIGYNVGNSSKITGNSYGIGNNVLTNEQDGGGTENLAFGSSILNSGILSGAKNVAFGFQNLQDVTTGDSNIGIGNDVGDGISTGNRNISIGENINYLNVSGGGAFVNTLTIGTQAYPEESNSVKIGGSGNRYDKVYWNNYITSGYSDFEFNFSGTLTGQTDESPNNSVLFKAPVSTGSADGGSIKLQVSPGGTSGTNQNSFVDVFEALGSQDINIFGGAGLGGGHNVISIADATTVPTTDPTGGGILYVESGSLKYRGSSGTVTTIAVS